MDKICENCFNWDDNKTFCNELQEYTVGPDNCSTYIPVSQCCGEEVDEDIMICPKCKEHC